MIREARRSLSPRPPPRRGPGRAFATYEGDESPRAPSDRTVSEYMIANERLGHSSHANRPGPSSHRSHRDNTSDIYVTTGAYRAPSEISRVSYPRSDVHSVRSKTSRRMGAEIETVATPSPFCPDTRGICCLMLLLNLGIMLITLGFIVVIQFYEPLFVWILGIVFLIFGFITLIGSLVYCVYVCRDARHPSDVAQDDFYWKHRWRTRVGSPSEIHYRSEDRFPDEDRYSQTSK